MLTANDVHERAKDEWVNGSGIDPSLFDLNCYTSTLAIEGQRITQWNRFSPGTGYWYSHSIEPRSGKVIEYGELKMYSPPVIKGREAKYLTYPKGKPAVPGLLKVSNSVWGAIAAKNNSERPDPDKTRDDDGFWRWVIDGRMPRIICEGRKKAGCLLSLGYAAISLNGVWNGRQKSYKKDHDRVIDGLMPFLGSESEIILCYDIDWQENPSVLAALKNLYKTIKATTPSVLVSVMTWGKAEGKGIDDVCVQSGEDTVHNAFATRQSFDEFIATQLLPDPFEDQVINFMAEQGKHFIYANTMIHEWTGTHYREVSDDATPKKIYPFLQKFSDPRTASKDEQRTNAASSYWAKRIIDQIKMRCYIESDQLNPPGYFNLENGVIQMMVDVDSRTAIPEFIERSHDNFPYFSYCSSFDYNPDADPKHWERMKQALDEPYRSIFLKTVAATIDLPSLRKVHGRPIRSLFLVGSGHNGKDTFATIFSQLFGSAFTAVSMDQVKSAQNGSDKFGTWPLIKSRINWDSEATKVQLDRSTLLKRLVTGDTISVQRKNRDAIFFQPNAAFFWNVNPNGIPSIQSKDAAITTRYGIISFDKTFVSNPSTPNELKGDARFKHDHPWVSENVTPAAFNEMLALFSVVLEEGIDYSLIMDSYNNVQKASSHIVEWIETVGLTSDPNYSLQLSELWDQLVKWYEKEGMGLRDGRVVRPVEQDKYDPVVTSSRKLKKRLIEADPRIEFIDSGRGNHKKPILNGWKFENPIH